MSTWALRFPLASGSNMAVQDTATSLEGITFLEAADRVERMDWQELGPLQGKAGKHLNLIHLLLLSPADVLHGLDTTACWWTRESIGVDLVGSYGSAL